jgi:ferritin-like metal-binding protein YciE
MTSEIESLRDLYVDQLKDLYSAENQITKALPKVIKKVTSPELKQALEKHLQETVKQVDRLDQIFESMATSPRGKKCVGMEGVLDESKEVMSEKMASPDLMDAALTGGCQKVEHYEISAYGTTRAFAVLLGEDKAVDLLTQTIEEERAADAKLTELGVNMINPRAVEAMSRERM